MSGALRVTCAGVPRASVLDAGQLGEGVAGEASVLPAPLCCDRGAGRGGGDGGGAERGGGAETDVVVVGLCCCGCVSGVVLRPRSSAGSARTQNKDFSKQQKRTVEMEMVSENGQHRMRGERENQTDKQIDEQTKTERAMPQQDRDNRNEKKKEFSVLGMMV